MQRSVSIITIALCSLCLFSLQLQALEVGEAAPSFTRPELSKGTAIHLAEHRGKVIYVDFWASWCGPCRLSLPAMDELYRELSPKGFLVIAVNVDEDREDAHQFLKSHPVSYPIVHDDGRLPRRFGVPGMPAAYLLDRQGLVRRVHLGFRLGDEDRLRAQILDLLKEKPPQENSAL